MFSTFYTIVLTTVGLQAWKYVGMLPNILKHQWVTFCQNYFWISDCLCFIDAIYLGYSSARMKSHSITVSSNWINFQQVSTIVAPILDLYTVGLCFVGSDIQARERDSIPEKLGSGISLFLDNEDIVRCLASFDLLAIYFHTSGDNNGLLSTYTGKRITDVPFIDCEPNTKIWKECRLMHGEISIFSYLNALHFLCKPFAEYVNTTWKHIVSEKEAVPLSANMKYIQHAFHQFCNVFINVFRWIRYNSLFDNSFQYSVLFVRFIILLLLK